MMRNRFIFKSLLLTIVAGTFLAACSSDDTEENIPAPMASNTYYMSVYASKSGTEESAAANSNYRRALSLDEENNRLLATWNKNEDIFVRYYNDWFTGSLRPDANQATAWLNGTITANGFEFEIPFPGSGVPAEPQAFTLQFPRKEIDYTGQIGTLEDIASRYDYIQASPLIDHVENNNITSSIDDTAFQNLQAIVRFTLKDQSGHPLYVSKLKISADGLKVNDIELGDITINPTQLTDVIFAALSGVNGTVTLTATVGNDTYVYTKSNITFSNGQYRHITVKMQRES